jgi:hypothetical protein
MKDSDVLVVDDTESLSEPEDVFGQDLERHVDDLVGFQDRQPPGHQTLVSAGVAMDSIVEAQSNWQ